jgi:hypothetical protein
MLGVHYCPIRKLGFTYFITIYLGDRIRNAIVAHTYDDVFSRSDLNRFLFAEVGVEPNGMTLSVLSALARHGADPWQQAEQLAGLSRPLAIDNLARLIATSPAMLWPVPAATEIAARLVTLLPARGVAAPLLPKLP